MVNKRRDIDRIQKLLRKIDLEEVLEDLGLEVIYNDGYNINLTCPDPNHDDNNPSFNVCINDTEDSKSKLGWFNCWSHPLIDDENYMRGLNFVDLISRIRFDIWDRWINEDERNLSKKWLRENYLKIKDSRTIIKESIEKRKKYKNVVNNKNSRLLFPPSIEIEKSRDEFKNYIKKRGITLNRAKKLNMKAVTSPGQLYGTLRNTLPGVLFPIKWNNNIVSWYIRSIYKVQPKYKGRNCPGFELSNSGILWSPDGINEKPTIIVEGIIDAERIRSICVKYGFKFNVISTLGCNMSYKQSISLRKIKNILHLADGDHAGIKLSKTIEKYLGNFSRIKIKNMPNGFDPGDVDEKYIVNILGNIKFAKIKNIRK